jgi:hypothetical protein
VANRGNAWNGLSDRGRGADRPATATAFQLSQAGLGALELLRLRRLTDLCRTTRTMHGQELE